MARPIRFRSRVRHFRAFVACFCATRASDRLQPQALRIRANPHTLHSRFRSHLSSS
jgi:hypothetical protein